VPIYFVRVCEWCHTLFFITEAYARHNAGRFCSQAHWEAWCSRRRRPEPECTASEFDQEVAYKALVKKMLWDAYREGDLEFLQSDPVKELAAWALGDT
jgi:hypothetical protein